MASVHRVLGFPTKAFADPTGAVRIVMVLILHGQAAAEPAELKEEAQKGVEACRRVQKGAEGCRQHRVPVVGGRPHAKTTAGLQDDRAASHVAEVSEKAPVLRPRFECWIRCLLFLPVRRLFLRKQKSGPRQLSPEALKSDGSGGFRVQGSAGSPSIFPCFCFRGSLGRPRLWRQLPRRHRSQQLDPCFPASPDLPRSGKDQSSDSSLRQAEPLKTPEPAEAMTDVWQHVGLSLSWLHLCMSLAAQPSAAAKFPALICRSFAGLLGW